MTSNITRYEYFYDGQQRRFLEQLVRAFSGFSYQTGLQEDGKPQTLMVPCHMAQTNKMVAQIMKGQSENALIAAPMITIWQSGLRGRRADLQNPNFVDHLQVFERNIVDEQYCCDRGNAYLVDRLMPLPFEMDIQVDLWTTNLDQKYQLTEQMLIATYPQFEIQNSENALDWTAVTVCFVEDDIHFNRAVPIGTNDDLDIMTLRLRVPIWLTPPALIHRLSRIEQVVANLGDKVDDVYGDPVLGTVYEQVIVTPGDHMIMVDGKTVTLLAHKGHNTMPDGSIPSWSKLLRQYGIFKPNVSELRLMLTDDIEGPFVSGTLQPGDAVNTLIWSLNPATLPINTLLPVDAVIDPMRTNPTHGLPKPVEGTRYLIVNDIGPSVTWGPLSAVANDIIQYNAIPGLWFVAYNSRTTITHDYVLNLHTNKQLRWSGREWLMSIDSLYGPGYWRLKL